MKGAVLTIGSLFWENEKNAIDRSVGRIRTEWRNSLDLQQKQAIRVPIRYGRMSNNRRHTYTMVFSTAAKVGSAYLIPYKKEIQSFPELYQQAMAMAYAECISTREAPDRLIANWAAVGIAFHPRKRDQLQPVIEAWHREFSGFNHHEAFRVGRENPAIDANGELNFAIAIPDHLDYVLATPVVANVPAYPSPEEVAAAIHRSDPTYATYLVETYRNGIRVHEDEKMIDLITGR